MKDFGKQYFAAEKSFLDKLLSSHMMSLYQTKKGLPQVLLTYMTDPL